jgi:hypothetical protein
VEFRNESRERSWGPRWLAPAQAGAIVGADMSESCDVWQHAHPAQRRRGDPGLEQNRRAAAACADHVQRLPVGFDEPPGWRIPSRAASSTGKLVHGAGSEKERQPDNQDHENHGEPTPAYKKLGASLYKIIS